MTEKLASLNIKDITPNPYQPRIEFKQEELEELAQSIRENGLIQPIIVRPSSVFGYELIAGERRLRAAQLAGLSKIPAVVKELSNEESMRQAIIENLQRANLNPIEEAKAYQQLIEKNQMTHEELAQSMGKSRPYITNSLRLLNLPTEISKALEKGDITPGHARVLLSLSDAEQQEDWYQKILNKNISVRQLEEAIKKQKNKKSFSKNDNIFLRDKEKELAKLLGTSVSLSINKSGAGQLAIQFTSEEELNRIINRLN